MCATQCDAGDVRTTYCDPTTDLIHVLPTTSPSLIRSVLEITVTASTIFGPSLARDMDANKNDGPSREMEKRWSMYGQISADGSDYQRTPIHISAPPPQRLHTDYSNCFNELSCPLRHPDLSWRDESDLRAVYADPMEVCAVIYCLSRAKLMPVYSITARIPVGVGSWLDISTASSTSCDVPPLVFILNPRGFFASPELNGPRHLYNAICISASTFLVTL